MSTSEATAMSDDAVEAAAAQLDKARRSADPLDRLPPELTPVTVEDGYRIQWAGHRLTDSPLGPWKVGATTKLAQQVLGVEGPFIGRPPFERLFSSGSEIVLSEWFVGTPAIETEIGLRLLQDMIHLPDDPMDLAGVVDVVPCLELVNSRFVDMTTVGAPSLIADNAVASAIVQGDRLDLDEHHVRALDTMTVSLHLDGGEAASGSGSLALGHPLNVLHYAAGLAISWNTPIRAGELVITGTCTGLVPAAVGTTAAGHFDGATVNVHFR